MASPNRGNHNLGNTNASSANLQSEDAPHSISSNDGPSTSPNLARIASPEGSNQDTPSSLLGYGRASHSTDLTQLIDIEGDRPIASGGFCEIWLGKHKGGRAVALKMVRSTVTSFKEDEKKKIRFEIRLWSSLNHPHILPFLGTCDKEYRTFIVTPYMKHGNVIEYLKLNPESNKQNILLQVASAVAYLHSGKDVSVMAHGDINGANVLIDDSGDALLADFGLARLVERLESITATPTSLRDVGTVRYMAPELLNPEGTNSTDIDRTKGDIYAFGCLVLELMSGSPPFAHLRNDAQVIAAIIRNELPGRHQGRMEDYMWQICLHCWKQDPTARPSMSDLTMGIKSCSYLAVSNSIQDTGRNLNLNFDLGRGRGGGQGGYDSRGRDRSGSLGRYNDPRSGVSGGSHPGRSRDGNRGGAIIFDSGPAMLDPRQADASQVPRPELFSATARNGEKRKASVTQNDRAEKPSRSAGTNDTDVDTDTDEKKVAKREIMPRYLCGHTREVFVCAWNPKVDDMLVSGSKDATVRIWDVPLRGATSMQHVLKHEVGGVGRDITTSQWNETGTLLATGSYDCHVRIWTSSGLLHADFELHEGAIFATKFSQDGKWLVASSLDGTASTWDVRKKKLVQHLRHHASCCLDVEWLDNTTFATCSADHAIHLCSLGSRHPQMVFLGHTDEVNQVGFSDDRTLLGSCSDDHTARIWSMVGWNAEARNGGARPSREAMLGYCLWELRGHTSEVACFKWCPAPTPEEQRLVATSAFDHSVRIWDAHKGTALRTFEYHMGKVCAIAFSVGGEYLATGSGDGCMFVYSTATGERLRVWKENDLIFDIQWHADGRRIAICLSEKKLVVVDFESIPKWGT